MFLNQISSYWNMRADGYSDSIHEEMDSEVAQDFKERFSKVLPEGRKQKCLDIGCGPGFFSMILAQAGNKVTAIDYSTEMLKYAYRNCVERQLQVEFVRADAQSLPFGDGVFDFVCSRNLIWNLEEPELAYKEWNRVLRPGGRLFIFDGNYYLHYYDEEYRKAIEFRKDTIGTEHHTMKGVDSTPIDEIARNLPLSRKRRPDWDQDVLERLGYKILDVERFLKKYVDVISNDEKEFVHSFILLAEKKRV